MKNMLLIIGFLVISVLIVSCTPGETLAGEASKIGGQSDVQRVNLEIKNVQKVVQDNSQIRKAALKLNTLNQKQLTKIATDIERCSAAPSCSSSNYVVTSTACSDFEAMGGGVESCYTCSVREDIRARARCPAGWETYGFVSGSYRDYPQGVDWHSHGFDCQNQCVTACGATQANPQTDCINACPSSSSLERPCPEGFTYSSGVNIPGTSTNGWFSCRIVGESLPVNSMDGICNQCGSDAFGNNAANGDTFCMIRN